MAAIIMVKISSLIETLINNYPSENVSFVTPTFITGEDFSWNHHTNTITYAPHDPHANELLLHEFGHAVLGHQDYVRDVTLLDIERTAWDKASELAASGHVPHISIAPELIDEALDTYRDWLHARSLCPACEATGIQTGVETYTCLACSTNWRVNEARTCALRRYPSKKRP